MAELAAALERLRRRRGPQLFCGARTRRGVPCRRYAVATRKNGRCPNHGGLSTGPKTARGKRRALANLRRGAA